MDKQKIVSLILTVLAGYGITLKPEWLQYAAYAYGLLALIAQFTKWQWDDQVVKFLLSWLEWVPGLKLNSFEIEDKEE